MDKRFEVMQDVVRNAVEDHNAHEDDDAPVVYTEQDHHPESVIAKAAVCLDRGLHSRRERCVQLLPDSTRHSQRML